MNVKKQFQKIYTLILNEEEACWLRELTQNPIIEDESEKSQQIRKAFFDSVSDSNSIKRE